MYDLRGILSGQLYYTKICIMSWSCISLDYVYFTFSVAGKSCLSKSFRKLKKKKKNHSLCKTKKFDSTKISTEVPKVLSIGALFKI